MTAKEYLSQVWRLDNEILQLKLRLEDIWVSLTSITADPSREYIDGSKNSGIPDEKIDELNEITARISKKRMDALSLKSRITLQVQELENPVYMQILYKRYIDHVGLYELSVAMGYEYKYFSKLHGKALNAFAARYPDLLKEDDQ